MSNVKGCILQKGSFNPLHRMHRKIADNAKQRFPEYPHTMLLSRKTCDKGENNFEELQRRARAIVESGYDVTFEDSGLFIDTIKETRTHMPGIHIVFPVGEDTMYRFFRDWDDYYNKVNASQDTRFEDYKSWFKDVTWYVSWRDCPEREQYAGRLMNYLARHNNVVWSGLDLDDISSSKIRTGEVPNE